DSHVQSAKESLGAANAIWSIARVGDPKLNVLIEGGAVHPDWRVRRLTMNALRRFLTGPDGAVPPLEEEKDPAVWLENVISISTLARGREGFGHELFVDALTKRRSAADPHLRYEAAWHLAKYADESAICKLLTSDDANVRLAGLIAIDA